MSLPFFDGVKQLQEYYLMFPAFQGALEQIESNLKLYRSTGIAQNLLITGESGTGKTTLCKVIEKRYPKLILPERDVIPIVYASVPPAATIAGTVEAMLRQLGDIEPERGTVSAKTARAVKIARGCGAEMLLLDEAQHVQDRGRSQTQYFVGDWLKSFMDAVGVPVTLFGLQRTEALLLVNEQLRRRFTHRLSLSTILGQHDATGAEVLQLFLSLAKALPIPMHPTPYEWSEFGARLSFATDGRIAYAKQLLIYAYKYALAAQIDRIDSRALELAFTSAIWSDGMGPLNPFHKNFHFRPLDRLGEPFQQGDIHVVRPSQRKNR